MPLFEGSPFPIINELQDSPLLFTMTVKSPEITTSSPGPGTRDRSQVLGSFQDPDWMDVMVDWAFVFAENKMADSKKVSIVLKKGLRFFSRFW
jgi:hypothetical protein